MAVETFENKKEAFKREWHLKHSKGYIDKIEIIKNIENNRNIKQGPIA